MLDNGYWMLDTGCRIGIEILPRAANIYGSRHLASGLGHQSQIQLTND